MENSNYFHSSSSINEKPPKYADLGRIETISNYLNDTYFFKAYSKFQLYNI